jgi:hypothetical protein
MAQGPHWDEKGRFPIPIRQPRLRIARSASVMGPARFAIAQDHFKLNWYFGRPAFVAPVNEQWPVARRQLLHLACR